ncbi:MAG: YciI family protein [Acidimicrobiales bacterium]|nr:YciI family protein [Acidimicrobiales bacterium]
MIFAIHALDRSDAGSLRAETRPTHLDYVAGFDVAYGGPLLDAEGDMCGSLVILEAEDLAAAEAFAAGDPYAVAGLFERVEIRGFRPLFGMQD